jgi:hypothetical protein
LGKAKRGIIFSAWQNLNGFPKKVKPVVSKLYEKGAEIVWSRGGVVANEPYYKVCKALHERNILLVKGSQGRIAFINVKSRGSVFTIKQAIKEKIPVVVFPVNSELPVFPGIEWSSVNGNSWEGAFEVRYLNCIGNEQFELFYNNHIN